MFGNGPLTKARVGEAVRVGDVVGIAYGADPIFGLRVAINKHGTWEHFDDVEWGHEDAETLGYPSADDMRACAFDMGYLWGSALTDELYSDIVAKHRAYDGALSSSECEGV